MDLLKGSASSTCRRTGPCRSRAACSRTGVPTSSRSRTPSTATSSGAAPLGRAAARGRLQPPVPHLQPRQAMRGDQPEARARPRGAAQTRRDERRLPDQLPLRGAPTSRHRCRRHPGTQADIVYGRNTGRGTKGPFAELGGFDATSFWSRAGWRTRRRPPTGVPTAMPAPAFGDSQTGFALAVRRRRRPAAPGADRRRHGRRHVAAQHRHVGDADGDRDRRPCWAPRRCAVRRAGPARRS